MKLTATIMNYDEIQPVGFPCQANCGRDAMAAIDMNVDKVTWRIWACIEDAQILESKLRVLGRQP